MLSGIFQHAEDDGALSLIAHGDQVFVVCDKGHYWVIDTPMLTRTDAARLSAEAEPRFAPAMLAAFDRSLGGDGGGLVP